RHRISAQGERPGEGASPELEVAAGQVDCTCEAVHGDHSERLWSRTTRGSDLEVNSPVRSAACRHANVVGVGSESVEPWSLSDAIEGVSEVGRNIGIAVKLHRPGAVGSGTCRDLGND